MRASTRRTTIYLEPDLHAALRVKAAEADCSVSELVNGAVREVLAENREDLATFDERAGEPEMTREELLDDLRASGKL